MAAFGAIVGYGSLENGIGWTELGPASGYFPFRIGVLIVAIGLAIAVRYATIGRARRPAATAAADPANPTESDAHFDERFFEPGSLPRIALIFVPTALAAAAIPWLGLYIASALFLIFAMVALGNVPAWKAVAIAVGTMAAFYAIFEFWFQVPLEKGLLMPMVGLY